MALRAETALRRAPLLVALAWLLASATSQASSLPIAACCLDEADNWETLGTTAYASGKNRHQSLWSRIEAGLTMESHEHRTRVQLELQRFTQHLPSLFEMLEKSEPYLFHVVEQIELRNLPMELALLPFIESKFEPYAHSIYGASGTWQFMPSTALHYGLRIDWWFDGRRDLVRSTEIALDYLESLVAYFNGDWMLAIAAYNVGQGRIKRLRTAARRQGKPTDFWSLPVPRETYRYVPALLALAQIVRWNKINDRDLPYISNSPYLRAVNFDGQVDLLVAAKAIGLELESLLSFNAGFRRWATPPQGPHRLMLPLEQADALEAYMRENPEKVRVSWDSYLIKPGDTLSTISELRDVQPWILRQLNGLQSNHIVAGTHLLVPADSSEITPRGGVMTHKVLAGETLQDISIYYGLPQRQLIAQNRLPPGQQPAVGTVLRIQLGPELPSEVRGPEVASYRVRSGDSLSVIAKRFGTTVEELQSTNELPTTNLYPGWELRIPLKNQN